MNKFDVIDIDRALYAVVQADHLLAINTIVVVPLRQPDLFPTLSRLTVDVQFNGTVWRVLCHMPLTLDARLIRNRVAAHRLSVNDGQRVMDGLTAILWGV